MFTCFTKWSSLINLDLFWTSLFLYWCTGLFGQCSLHVVIKTKSKRYQDTTFMLPHQDLHSEHDIGTIFEAKTSEFNWSTKYKHFLSQKCSTEAGPLFNLL
jgi:hypothetical protein